MDIKKIFVCEFITGGGLIAEPLPKSLVNEGARMRDALLRDLKELGYHISTTIDARLDKPALADECTVVDIDQDIWQVWEAQMTHANAVWIVAPETDGALHYLTQIAALKGLWILGCGLDSIAVAGNKLATYQVLSDAGIRTPKTYIYDAWSKGPGAWIAKPDDGAGCDDTVFFHHANDLSHWMQANKKTDSHVIQPFIDGTMASISCVMAQNQAHVLSCNTQLIEIRRHVVSYHGSILNGELSHRVAMQQIAQQVLDVMPTLAGYVGIDVVIENGNIWVLDVNPRLTTSYVGMREAIGCNPAELIIEALAQPHFNWPELAHNRVEVLV